MNASHQFNSFVRARAAAVGYDLSGPRSGGRKKLADDTGMSLTSVCRMLNGETLPAPEVFESIAIALDVHVGVLFELACVVSPGVFTRGTVIDLKPLTARQAAERLGIRGALRLDLFEAMAATLLAGRETA